LCIPFLKSEVVIKGLVMKKNILNFFPSILLVLCLSVFIGCSDDDNTESIVEAGDDTEDEDDDGFEYPVPEGPQLAFPGAEGAGLYTSGGRAGDVYIVNRLDDPEFISPPAGTIRHAINQTGARTIVFAVSGDIQLTRALNITSGDLTIAGQTAPGGGITIRDYPVQIDADNVIIRFLRFRLGDETATEADAIWGRSTKNILIDHCSMSWSTDECASFYNNENFTMQWCLIAESLNESVHDKGSHGYGGLWGGYKATFHNNLLAHHKSRNPRFYGVRDGIVREQAEIINNVIYNWGDNSAYGGEGGEYNIINNYYKAGPATKNHRSRIFEAYKVSDYGRFYVNGNYVDGEALVTNDNWLGFDLKSGGDKVALKVDTAFDISDVTILPAQEAFENVLKHAGMSMSRDAIDERIINEVQTGTASYGGSWGAGLGLIDTQSIVGGWPELQSEKAPVDSDGDGMPDAWEVEKKLDPEDAEDGKKYILSPDYTNLEVYLNGLVSDKIGFGQ
jgi:pectate lyase